MSGGKATGSDEPVRRFLQFRESARTGKGRRRSLSTTEGSEPFAPGRDPLKAADTVESLAASLGWERPLSESRIIAAWTEIVGESTAEHAELVSVDDGVLSVRCDSTAWATQLRLMRRELITRLAREFPEAGVVDIRFAGPDVPSWKRGRRSVPGRGPRDTYG